MAANEFESAEFSKTQEDAHGFANGASQLSQPSTNEASGLTVDSPASEDNNVPSEGQPRTAAAPTVKICGICNQNEGKYKCTKCYLPYCSVACSKAHKATHSADEPTPKISTPSSPPSSNGAVPRPGTKAAAGYKGPFAALEESKELKELFRIYPSLPSQLEEIDTATLRPLDNDFGTRRKGGKFEAWNPDKGIEKGREALSKARNTSGEEGEGVREFSKLVLQILSGEDGGKTAEAIEKERREESYRAIEALLNNER